MKISAPPPLPKEHGAWTMVSIPVVLGLFITHASSVPAGLIGASTWLAFLAHYAIVPWAARAREGKGSPPGYAARRIGWGLAYLAGSLACFAAALVTSSTRSVVLPIGAASASLAAAFAVASIMGVGRMLIFEILGMGGMALVASMMAAAAGRPASSMLFAPAYLSLSYFLSSLAFVRTYDASSIFRSVAAQTTIVLALAVVDRLGGLIPFWWISWIPIVVRTAVGTVRPPANLRVLGVREAWVAVAFTLLAGLAVAR